MTLPPNNPGPGFSPAIPMATVAPPMPPQMEYAPLDQIYYPRTRGWLITAGTLWILIAIPAILTSAGMVIGIITDFDRGRSAGNELIAVALGAVLSISLSVFLLKLAVGTFRIQRWTAKAGAVMAMILLMLSSLNNPFYALLESLEYRNYFSPISILFDGVASILPLAVSALLTFIYLRPNTIQQLNTRRTIPSWTDNYSTSRLLMIACPMVLAIVDLFSLLLGTTAGVSSGTGSANTSTRLFANAGGLVLAITLVVLTLRNIRRSWILALIVYGYWIFRDLYFSDRGDLITPSFDASLILLLLLMPLLHWWFGHEEVLYSASAFPVLAGADGNANRASASFAAASVPMATLVSTPATPRPAIPSDTAPPATGFPNNPDVPMATMIAEPAGKNAPREDDASRQSLINLQLPQSIRRCGILWLCVAFLQSCVAYDIIFTKFQAYVTDYIASLPYGSSSGSQPLFQNFEGISPLLLYSLLSMIGFASIGIGLLRKSRWAECVASVILLPVLLISIILPLTYIAQVMQPYQLPVNSSTKIGYVLDFLKLAAVILLINFHRNPQVFRHLRQINSFPLPLDDIPRRRLRLIACFIIASIFEAILALGMEAYLPTKGLRQGLTDGLPSILVAIGFMIAAYLSIKNIRGWQILGGSASLIYLAVLSQTPYQWYLIAPDLGLPLCQAALCCLILLFLVWKPRTPKPTQASY